MAEPTPQMKGKMFFACHKPASSEAAAVRSRFENGG